MRPSSPNRVSHAGRPGVQLLHWDTVSPLSWSGRGAGGEGVSACATAMGRYLSSQTALKRVILTVARWTTVSSGIRYRRLSLQARKYLVTQAVRIIGRLLHIRRRFGLAGGAALPPHGRAGECPVQKGAKDGRLFVWFLTFRTIYGEKQIARHPTRRCR